MKLITIITLSFLIALAISIREFIYDFITGLIYFVPALIGSFLGLGGYKYFKRKKEEEKVTTGTWDRMKKED